MDLSEEQKQQWNLKLLETLTALVNICDENQFRYFLGYGTAIGAVRHGGIIPWDDDIDVAMPRPDYEKFRNYCKNHNIGKYHLFAPETNEDCYTMFMKFTDMSTTLLETVNQKMSIGIYVDIFPLDGCSNDMNTFMSSYERLKKTVFHLFREANENKGIWYGVKMLMRGKYLCFIRSVFITLIGAKRCHQWAIKTFHNYVSKYRYDTSEYVVNYLSGYGGRERMERSIYGDGKYLAFEGKNFRVPEHVDSYLKSLYGDYMQLPPEEQRKSHHNCVYVNFNEHKEKEEILFEMTGSFNGPKMTDYN